MGPEDRGMKYFDACQYMRDPFSWFLDPDTWYLCSEPSTTTLGIISAVSALAGVGTGIAGTISSADAATEQAQSQAAALRAKAAADKAQANLELGYSQREALQQRRKTELALSRSQALAAAGGGLATDPSTLALESDIAGQGEYNALAALAAGQTRAGTLQQQADIDLFNADRYLRAGDIAQRGAIFSGIGNIASSASSAAYRSSGLFDSTTPTARRRGVLVDDADLIGRY
jgi:hypothetical protein